MIFLFVQAEVPDLFRLWSTMQAFPTEEILFYVNNALCGKLEEGREQQNFLELQSFTFGVTVQ